MIRPIHHLAVPTFFVISSFLFFRKERYSNDKTSLVLHFVKRLAALYFFWCVVWSPIVFIQKDYFHPMTWLTPIYLIREFFFGEVFDASWFFGALLVGVPLIALFMRKLNEWLVLLGIIVLYELPNSHVLTFDWFLSFQDWFKQYVCERGTIYSFPKGLLWICIGYILAKKEVLVWMNRANSNMAWISALVFFVLQFFVSILPMILCVVSLFVAAYTWQLPEHPQLYRRFRTYSILFYVIHGCFKKIPKQLFGWENGPVLFVVTLAFCFLASEMILRMKEVKGFGWLKYAY